MNGYSDRINHALAFAAKHHDQQVRRGTRPPYTTKPANLAIILTRYERDEDTVVAGILLDVVQDYSRGANPADVLQSRIGEKFGDRVLAIASIAAERRLDDEGLELDPEERHAYLLKRLGGSAEEGQVLAAAEALHGAGSLLADLRRTVEAQSVWARVPGGKDRILETWRLLHDRLAGSGLRAAILDELRETITALEAIPG